MPAKIGPIFGFHPNLYQKVYLLEVHYGQEKVQSASKSRTKKDSCSFEETERWFEDLFRRPFSLTSPRWWPNLRMPDFEEVTPSVDIFEDGDIVIVKAELPGMSKEDIHVTLAEDTLIWRKEERTEG